MVRSRLRVLQVVLTIIYLPWLTTGSWISTPLDSSNVISSRRASSHPSERFGMTPDDDKGDKIKILGVGGGIGSGKSAACELLVSELGCAAHIDADSVAHKVYQPGSQALQEIAKAFGSVVMLSNGELDRKKLGSIVFADRGAMRKLEEIVWPHTKDEILSQIETIRSELRSANEGTKLPIVIVEAAILLDTEWYSFMDGVWMVTVPPEIAIKRIMEGRGCSQKEAEQRIEAQKERRGIGNLEQEVANKVVTAVIDNTSGLEDLKQRLSEKLRDPDAWY